MEIIISVFLLFCGIAILVIIHICIVGRAFSRGFGADGVPYIKGAGMTLQDLKKLPCFEYSKQQTVSEKETSAAAAAACEAAAAATEAANTDAAILDCAVCLDSFEVGDYCRSLPNCHHYFHVQCVDVWLTKSPFCPVCRTCTVIKLSPKVVSSVGDAGRNATSPNVAVDLC